MGYLLRIIVSFNNLQLATYRFLPFETIKKIDNTIKIDNKIITEMYQELVTYYQMDVLQIDFKLD